MEPEGVRVPVGDAGLEGESEGYADTVEVVEGVAPAVMVEVGVRVGWGLNDDASNSFTNVGFGWRI